MAGVLARIDQGLVRLFGVGPTAADRRRERLARAGSCTVLSLTGLALLVPNLAPVLVGRGPVVGMALTVLGTVVSFGLVAAGVLLFRSDFSTPNAVRIAVWNFLGLVVLGVVLLAHGLYRGAFGTVTSADALAAGNVLAISAAAHVIIGVHDARRVRAEQLAHEREKFAVLSRVLRHNLRNDATVLIGQSERLAAELDDPSLAEVAETLSRRSQQVGGLADKTKTMVEALDRRSAPNDRVPVADVVDAVFADARGRADCDVESDVPADLWMWADDGVASALAELVENAVEHGGDRVRITAEAADGQVHVRVADDGAGVPESERAVVSGESEITQLNHGSGLGLWVARSIAESAGGTLTFDTEGEWTVVGLVHGRASSPSDGAAGVSTATESARATA
jgi:signal transduction histidine kinase